MGFQNVVFPTEISYGSTGGPRTSTSITVLDTGTEQRIVRWNTPRRRYDVGYDIRSFDELYEVQAFFIARDGPANSFSYKDWLDYSTAANGRDAPARTDESLGFGDASNATFQLKKRYTSGSQTKTRTITKPVSGTVLVEVNSILQTEGFHYTVDYTTGIITFDAGAIPGSGLEVRAGCNFYVEVRFENDDVMNVSLDAFEDGAVPSIMLVEVIDAEGVSDDFPYGGGTTFDPVEADFNLSVVHGSMIVLKNVTSGQSAFLPPKANLNPGGPYFSIANEDSTDSISIKDIDSGAERYVLAAGNIAEVWLSDEKNWYVR